MRASGGIGPFSPGAKSAREIHISGAEGLYRNDEILRVVREYTRRALNHPRGAPEKVVISIEKLRETPKAITALSLSTIKCTSPRQARTLVRKLLLATGVSETAINNSFKVIKSNMVMRGAALISAQSGKRLEPDRAKGVRASRIGIERNVFRALSMRLGRLGLNNDTVKEALMLASKVASCRGVLAELCISDDPDYTTGYVASRKYGYVRVPGIKNPGSRQGGRALFIESGADIKYIMDYLQYRPVIVSRLSEIRGFRLLNEFIQTQN